jgi:tRNA pseudouridine65 synthase
VSAPNRNPRVMAEPESLAIIFRDEHLVAIHKPAGLLVHRTDIDRHETRFAVQLLRQQIGQRVHPVHRLDKGASGVLVFALNHEVARTLGLMFERQEVRKTYLAVVRGHPPAAGEIDHPLRPRFDEMESGAAPGDRGPRQAKTAFQCLATTELQYAVDRYPTSWYALVQLEPLTGRRHQLRRHLKHIAHPIVGDATYGKGRHNRLFHTLFGCDRLLLACVELCLAHPVTGTPLTLTAPLAGEFAKLLERLDWTARVPPEWLCARPALEVEDRTCC